MHYDANGALRHSPKDLIAYLEGDFASWMERLAAERHRDPSATPDRYPSFQPDDDPTLALAARLGGEHEVRYLDQLKREGREVVTVPNDHTGVEWTEAAMRAGAEVIFQAHLQHGVWHGYADFLYRTPGTSLLGDWHYVPWDTKLARSVKPYFLIQLSAYAEMLEAFQGVRPETMTFVLGTNLPQTFRVDEVYHYYLSLKRSFLAFQEAWSVESMPFPGFERSFGRWSDAADEILSRADHPSLIARVTRSQARRLVDAGLDTLTRIAESRESRVPGIAEATWERIQTQARLQHASAGKAIPEVEVVPPDPREPRRGLALLPPASPGDIFFDLEGFPFAENGLEYLFGAVARESDGFQFHDWWAHDPYEEQRAFEACIDWIHARWRADPTLHVYHYAPYERSALQRLMGRYATREEEVDDLLRHEVLVDLYRVVRQGLRVGAPSYSLKEIERLYRKRREGAVTTAGDSVIDYQRWIDSGEPREWQQSPTLKGIRDYNRDDCVSTAELYDYLQRVQSEVGVAYLPLTAKEEKQENEKLSEPRAVRATLATRLHELAAAEPKAEHRRVGELLAWLLEYHRREEKPFWWKFFERQQMTEHELGNDADCLAGLGRTETEPVAEKRSFLYEYTFDPDQETTVEVGERYRFAHNADQSAVLHSLDREQGQATLKLGRGKEAPHHLSLIPMKFVSAASIEDAIQVVAEQWLSGEYATGPTAMFDFLLRQRPRLIGRGSGPVIPDDVEILPATVDAVRALDHSTLCIQGPPGAGKTHTAATVIRTLVRDGARVAVTSNSHKAILNLLRAVKDGGENIRVVKAGGHLDDSDRDLGIGDIDPKEVDTVIDQGPVVIGGTAWTWVRPELAGRFDYLFVDEAGQVALANLVGMGLAARNIVLIGDQMQLDQPTQGSHPGESGLSSLDYLLQSHATIPPDLGVFLPQSYRMHPTVCRFVSDTVYEGRLSAHASTGQRWFEGSDLPPHGAYFVPVTHEGCTRSSREEIEVVHALVTQLLAGRVVDAVGGNPRMKPEDILVVAPFNRQVRLLRSYLPPAVRVGTVDRFQGQESEIVLFSLTASSLEEAPRGSEFLLSPNRINVAISRARLLALVVGSPGLLDGRCRTIEEMKRVNLICRLPALHGPDGTSPLAERG